MESFKIPDVKTTAKAANSTYRFLELNMATTLTYSKATTGLLDSAEVIQLRPQQYERPLSSDGISTATRAQLNEPLNYPPLSQATISGDRVVLAIEPGIPQQLSVLDGALTALRDAGAEADFVTILLSSPMADIEKLKNELAALGHSECHVKVHDPDNEKENGFLGATQAGLAMRLNRQLCDADFVLPITVTKGDLRRGSSPSSFAGLFPAFSDRETLERFSTVAAEFDEKTTAENLNETAESLSEIEACGRLLGVGMTLQIVPSPGGQVSAILAGEPSRVASQAQASYRQTWCCETELRGDLVIATLTGDAAQQTWQNVGRALAAAEVVLETGGAIAIYSELEEQPGLALGQLAGNQDYLVVEREILRNPSADTVPAMQLCRALQRGPVYLRSKLRAAVVESLGMTPLESDSELEHLAQTLRPCLVLEEAQRLLPTVLEAEE